MDDRESHSVVTRIGGLSAYLYACRFGANPLAAMKWVYARHGPLTEFSFGSPTGRRVSRYVLAVGSKYNKRVLGDPATFQSTGMMLAGPKGSAQRRISNGLLGANSAHQAHYRRMLLPPLRRSAIDKLASKMGEIIDRTINDWPLHTPVDLFPLIKTATLHVALETLFPAEEGCGRDEALAAAKLMNDHIAMEGSPSVRICPINSPGLPYHHMVRHAEGVEAALAAWVKKDGVELRPDNLLSILAHTPDELGAPPTEAIVSRHLPTLFAASYETSQTALTWVLFLLAQHPSAAAVLLDEIKALPNDGFTDHLGQCLWLDAVVKESMRLLPVAPWQTRRATRDTDLVDCDLAAGAYVVLGVFLTNREPALFSDPDRFKPERWSSIDPTQYEYLAFSAGPRSCIGGWFAMTFLRVAVAHIMRRYRLNVVPLSRIDHTVRLTLTPMRSGVPVTIHAQDGRFERSPIRGNILDLVRS